MPLDIRLFRAHEGGNPDLIRESQRRRFASVELVDEIITKDDAWRYMTGGIDNLKAKRNKIQKEVATKKKAGEPCDDMVAEIKTIGDEIVAMENEQKELRTTIDKMVTKIGNIVEDEVPISQDEDKDNRVERSWGTPRDPAGLLNHHDLLWRIGGYEPERGAAVAGHRGYFLRDVGVLLNQAFINYGIAFLRARNYCVLQPPYMMKKDVMAGVAQLEQFDEELYKVGGDTDDKYLIATSEQPLCGYHMGEWMDEKSLPLRYSGISTCFRKEAGSHGKDTWGIFRVHQFEKVEQFVICEGDLEVSKKMQDEMIRTAEEFYQSLGFPYHVINIVSGALNNAAIKKLDLECWFPGYNAYRELVSCSNCTDYQSRSMEIRCGGKKMGDREKKYVHMLNATLCATGRAICCLLETYQEPDGVRIPEVLVPFMGGITFLPFVRDSKLALKAAPSEGGAAAAAGGGEGAQAAAKKSAPAPAPAKAAAAAPKEALAAPQVAPEFAALAAAIEAKGEEIRVLKAAGGDKAAVKVLVDALLELKAEFKEKSGGDYGAKPGAAPAATKPAAAAKASAPPPPPAAAASASAPAVPIAPPAYTTPAPVRRGAPSKGDVFSGDALDTAKLEAHLTDFSYVGGYLPSQEDVRALASATGDYTAFPNVSRWLRNVSSFTEEEKAAWP